jgi:hypothetical protein
VMNERARRVVGRRRDGRMIPPQEKLSRGREGRAGVGG